MVQNIVLMFSNYRKIIGHFSNSNKFNQGIYRSYFKNAIQGLLVKPKNERNKQTIKMAKTK